MYDVAKPTLVIGREVYTGVLTYPK